MSLRKITAAKVYFITISVYRHIDFFTRREYSEFMLEWIRLYQSEYSLVVYDWVIMPNGDSGEADPVPGILTPLIRF